MTALLLWLLVGAVVGHLAFSAVVELRERRAWRKMFGTTRNRAYREAHTIRWPR